MNDKHITKTRWSTPRLRRIDPTPEVLESLRIKAEADGKATPELLALLGRMAEQCHESDVPSARRSAR